MRDLVSFRDFNPFRMLDEIERDMRRFLDSYPSKSGSLGASKGSFLPRYDVIDKDSHILLSFDLPGVPQEDINVEVKDNQLCVSGERKSETKDGDYSERMYGRFERVMTLPQGVDADQIEAHYENGVLTLAVPKVEDSKAKKITIGHDRKSGIWSRLLGEGKKSEGSSKVEIKDDKSRAA